MLKVNARTPRTPRKVARNSMDFLFFPNLAFAASWRSTHFVTSLKVGGIVENRITQKDDMHHATLTV
jgi:hypothetical protein